MAFEIETPVTLHLCCDNCAKDCDCGDERRGDLVKFPGMVTQDCADSTQNSKKSRVVSKEQQKAVYYSLTSYHKSLLKEIVKKHHSNLKVPSIKFMLGFSEVQIDQVVKNCHCIFTKDVQEHVEVWHFRHTNAILNIIAETFNDIKCEPRDCFDLSSTSDDSIVFEDIDVEWECLIQDDELFDFAVENLSVTLSEYVSFDASNVCDIPDAALNALEHLDY